MLIFTLSKLQPDGSLQLLAYDGEDGGQGITWSSLLKDGTELDAGDYMLVTGTRLASGTVLAKTVSFTIQPGKTTLVDLVMRESKDEVQVIGSFNSESRFTEWSGERTGDEQSLLQACGRGYFVVGILGVNQEPTNHALRDLEALNRELEGWGRKLVLLFPDEVSARKYSPGTFPNLPSTILYGIDTENMAGQITEAMNLPQKGRLPIFIIADTFNRVVFLSQGYNIGLGEQLMKTVAGL